jgi:hypothetical protein
MGIQKCGSRRSPPQAQHFASQICAHVRYGLLLDDSCSKASKLTRANWAQAGFSKTLPILAAISARRAAYTLAIALGIGTSFVNAIAGQQGGSARDGQPRCFVNDAIVDGERQPPTTALVKEREMCLALSGAGSNPGEPSVDMDSNTQQQLDRIYEALERTIHIRSSSGTSD